MIYNEFGAVLTSCHTRSCQVWSSFHWGWLLTCSSSGQHCCQCQWWWVVDRLLSLSMKTEEVSMRNLEKFWKSMYIYMCVCICICMIISAELWLTESILLLCYKQTIASLNSVTAILTMANQIPCTSYKSQLIWKLQDSSQYKL